MEVGKLEKEVACDVVYNFVLSNSHVMTINDVECVTLGHGYVFFKLHFPSF